MTPRPADDRLANAFRQHERFLWGLCFRMTGCAADADDLVQDAFARAIERSPGRTDDPLRPWLVCVTMNLARDFLRRRRRRHYVGPWLPSPLEDGDDPPAFEPVFVDDAGRPITTEGRYDLIESVSFVFLLALEGLTPRQRAVLLLRDVFDYPVRDTAEALALSEENVKTTLHRARHAMRTYDRDRLQWTPALRDRTHNAIAAFLAAVTSHDRAALAAVFTADVELLSDGAGEFHAARVAVVGANKVATFFATIGQRSGVATTVRVATVSGRPALVVTTGAARRGDPPRFVLVPTVAPDGRVKRLYAILATRKLTAVR